MKLPRTAIVLCVLGAVAGAAQARPANFTEVFDDISMLPGQGWSFQNNSAPLGLTNWFQGNPAVFSAHSGATNSYMAANFNNTGDTGTISNWSILPTMSLNNGDTLKFYTRMATPIDFPDRLEVRLSENGSSSDVGMTSGSVGDFSTLLLSINPTLVVGGYPLDWTEFSVTLSGLGGPISGRLAFRYFVTDAGGFGTNSNYIGIDDVCVTFAGQVIPLPTAGLMASAGMGVICTRRRRAIQA